ncbi:MAG: hypothetical protein J6X01_07025 [Bacteroidales bacterium]|nr:hypothetical protein [Bacteroidales bacterium]
MNKFPLLIIIALIPTLLCCCRSEQAMIEENALGYLTAMGNYQIKEAEVFATEETIQNTLHVIEETIMPNVDPTYIRQNTPATIEITKVHQINDTTAKVSYTKTTPIQVQKGTLDMVKRNNEWKAVVFIHIPAALKTQSVDTKAIEEKYMGKLKVADISDTTLSNSIRKN